MTASPCTRPAGRRGADHANGCHAAIESAVAAAFAIPIRDLRAAGRGSAASALARQSAMYLAHVACGANLTRVGAMFGRDRTTVAHACRKIEEMRERPDLDALMTRLEAAIAARGIDADASGRGA